MRFVIKYSPRQNQAYFEKFVCYEGADAIADIKGDAKELDALPDTLDPGDTKLAIVYSEYDEGETSPARSYSALATAGKQVKVLHLVGLHLDYTGFWINIWRWFPNLTDIIITDIATEPRSLRALSRCRSLKRVGIHRSNAGASHFAALAREGTSIETVCLLDNEDLTDDDVAAIEKMETHVQCIVDDHEIRAMEDDLAEQCDGKEGQAVADLAHSIRMEHMEASLRREYPDKNGEAFKILCFGNWAKWGIVRLDTEDNIKRVNSGREAIRGRGYIPARR